MESWQNVEQLSENVKKLTDNCPEPLQRRNFENTWTCLPIQSLLLSGSPVQRVPLIILRFIQWWEWRHVNGTPHKIVCSELFSGNKWVLCGGSSAFFMAVAGETARSVHARWLCQETWDNFWEKAWERPRKCRKDCSIEIKSAFYFTKLFLKNNKVATCNPKESQWHVSSLMGLNHTTLKETQESWERSNQALGYRS